MPDILVVDDEPNIRKIVSLLLTTQGHRVRTAATGEEAISLLAAKTVDLLLLDFSLPGLSGLDVIRRISERRSLPCTVVMTAFGSIRSAVEVIKAGAFDYVTKPFDNDQLLLAIDRGLAHVTLHAEVKALRRELERRYGFDEFVGASPSMREVFRIMEKIAASDATVLVLGESGTGKELVARAVHRHSKRRSGPFVAVNCSAIPSSLLEAEFFGYERGAFTDAKETHAGKFEQAHLGTLFLDEIGDLPLEAQAKLLRVLEERHVTRLGSRKPTPTDVRVIAATNRALETAVSKGDFREDLYWRLNVLSIRLPPLRERGDDLLLLIDHLLRRLALELGLAACDVSPEALRLMLAHPWPGNVRELENTLRRSLILAEGTTLRAEDLPPRLRSSGSDAEREADDRVVKLPEAVAKATENLERTLIHSALLDSAGNRSVAAQQLGINRKTLFNKMKLYGLTADAEDAES